MGGRGAGLRGEWLFAGAAVAWGLIGWQLGCGSGLLVGRDQATSQSAGLQIEGAPTSPVAVMIGKPTPLPPVTVRNVGSLALGGLKVSLLPAGVPIMITSQGCSRGDLAVGMTCAVDLTATATNSAAPLVTGTLVVSDGDGRSTASAAVSIAPAGLSAHLEPDQPLAVAPGCSSMGKIVINNDGPEATDFHFTSSAPALTVSLEKASCAVGNVGARGECSLDLSSTAITGAPVAPWMVTITGTAGGTAIVAVPLNILPAISVSPPQATVIISPNGEVGTTTLSVRTGADGALVYDSAPDAGVMSSFLSVYGCDIAGIVAPAGQNTLTIAPCATCELTVVARGTGPYSRTIAFSAPRTPTTALAQVVVMVVSN